MMRSLPVLIIVCVLAATSHASTACRRIGTQLKCNLGASQVVIGTQAADEPTYATSLRPQKFHDPDRLPNDRAAARKLPFEIDLQDFGADLSLCREIGNEPDCY